MVVDGHRRGESAPTKQRSRHPTPLSLAREYNLSILREVAWIEVETYATYSADSPPMRPTSGDQIRCVKCVGRGFGSVDCSAAVAGQAGGLSMSAVLYCVPLLGLRCLIPRDMYSLKDSRVIHSILSTRLGIKGAHKCPRKSLLSPCHTSCSDAISGLIIRH